MNANDFLKTLDLTAFDDVTGSQANQNLETATPSSDRGFLLVTTDSALDTPIVPDPADYARFKRYGWLRKSFGETSVPKLYAWQDGASSDATYLKWVEISLSLAELNTFLGTYLPVYFADNPIDGADISTNTIPLTALAQTTQGVLGVATAGTGNVTLIGGALPYFPLQLGAGGSLIWATVKSDGIATQAVLADHLAPGSVTNNAITDNLISGDKLTDASVSSDKLEVQAAVTAATYGSAIAIPVVTYNDRGIATSVTLVATLLQAVYQSAETAIPAAGASQTFAHGLAGRPRQWNITLIVDDAGGDLGYADNTEVDVHNFYWGDGNTAQGFVINISATNITITRPTSASSIFTNTTAGIGALTAIDTAKWKIIVTALR